jgi:hypothetical protein
MAAGRPLLDETTQVICKHSGTAKPTVTNTRVKLSGQATVVVSTSYTVTGCPLPPQSGGPCATAQWLNGTTRVRSGGQALLFQDSQSTCAPTGTPLSVVTVQTRVSAI